MVENDCRSDLVHVPAVEVIQSAPETPAKGSHIETLASLTLRVLELERHVKVLRETLEAVQEQRDDLMREKFR